MKIEFRQNRAAETLRILARVVDQDKLPADLPRAMAEGAAASRFTGKAGQVFDGFHEMNGRVVQLALAGAGEKGDAGRQAALEKAGAALAAKYLTSGESALALDAGASGLDAAETAAVLTGARLRAWRWDTYRTKLRDEQKPTLKSIVVLGAPEGSEAAWEDAQAVAAGVECTRELVAEPANIIYPESCVERCQKRLAAASASPCVASRPAFVACHGAAGESSG